MDGGRGMPSVALSKQTEERIEAEEKADEKKPETAIFSKPSLDIKPTSELAPIPENPEVKVLSDVIATPKKPKKKLTEKQLEALARGRQKSIEVRKNKAGDKIKVKAEKQQFVYNEPEPITPPKPAVASNVIATPQTVQIDYERIINGVTNAYEKRLTAKQQKKLEDEQRAQAVNEQVGEFEEKIRADERLRLQTKMEEEHKKNKIGKEKKITENVYGRGGGMNAGASASANPYAYAFQMGARNRFPRY